MSIDALTSHHQRGFLLKKMGTADPQTDIIQRLKVLGTFIPKQYISNKSLSWGSDNPAVEVAKRVKEKEEVEDTNNTKHST